MRRRIVCFGDSNTWGYNPATEERYDEDVRWTGILAELLGDGYRVVEEGQNGRTVATDSPSDGGEERPHLSDSLYREPQAV